MSRREPKRMSKKQKRTLSAVMQAEKASQDEAEIEIEQASGRKSDYMTSNSSRKWYHLRDTEPRQTHSIVVNIMVVNGKNEERTLPCGGISIKTPLLYRANNTDGSERISRGTDAIRSAERLLLPIPPVQTLKV